MGDTSKKLTYVIVAVIVIALAAYGLYEYGMSRGKEEVQKEVDRLSPIIEKTFPKPVEVLNATNGKVTGIYGATLVLSIADPLDYLPHTDGSPRKMITKYATVTPKTNITVTSISGSPKAGKLTDIKVGTSLSIRTTSNIRIAEKFDATEITVVNY